MDRTDVVTVFLVNDDSKVLLLQRSDDVRTYQGHWAGVSGYLECTDPLLQAEIELREETGLGRDQIALEKRGASLAVDDDANDQHWRVHPFQFRLMTSDGPRIDREHERFEWCDPAAIADRATVPALRDAWERVRGE